MKDRLNVGQHPDISPLRRRVRSFVVDGLTITGSSKHTHGLKNIPEDEMLRIITSPMFRSTASKIDGETRRSVTFPNKYHTEGARKKLKDFGYTDESAVK